MFAITMSDYPRSHPIDIIFIFTGIPTDIQKSKKYDSSTTADVVYVLILNFTRFDQNNIFIHLSSGLYCRI